ncbi:hypothetical protein FisN_2HuN16 [Fistulifera solaris]|uniref:Helicase-associated domain-containing protein n=1 Tax=Fistulifera solaris TaxID=1519565 RepID=A0A1Z5JGK0_FISSO|nr:hypothetical protein FisN_2HuN16 [Fistulifera solaris]|eukprot:GAX13056.1 hypothetical protein FisN_2HuN16 [Fistulifera solaris]
MEGESNAGAMPATAAKNDENVFPDVQLESTPDDVLWMQIYRQVVALQQVSGQVAVHSPSEKYLLDLWIKEQRQRQKRGTLPKDREQLLVNSGILSKRNVRASNNYYNDEQWMDRYNRLKAVKERTGELKVKHAEDPELANWIGNQKNFQRQGKLRQDREELLTELGLKWYKPKGVLNATSETVQPVAPEQQNERHNVDPPMISNHHTETTEPEPETSLRLASTAATASKPEQCVIPEQQSVQPSIDIPTAAETTDLIHTEASKPEPVDEASLLLAGTATSEKKQAVSPEQHTAQPDIDTPTATATTELIQTNTEPKSVDEASLLFASTGQQLSTAPFDASVDDDWMEQYKRVEAFQKEQGHCNIKIPDVDGTLAFWIVDQQTSQKEGTLQKNREKLLHDLGFIWIKEEDGKEPWCSTGKSEQAMPAEHPVPKEQHQNPSKRPREANLISTGTTQTVTLSVSADTFPPVVARKKPRKGTPYSLDAYKRMYAAGKPTREM